MFKQFIFSLGANAKEIWRKHGRSILTGVGIGGMFAGSVVAAIETPKAVKKIEQKKEELNKEKLTAWEATKEVWKFYILPASLEVAGAGCIIAAHVSGERRNAALAAAAALYENSYNELKDKTKEVLGEKKAKTIDDEISKDKVKEIKDVNKLVIDVNEGPTLVMDGLTNHLYFYSIEKINLAEIELRKKCILQDGVITVNDYLDAIHLPTVGWGWDYGWKFNVTSTIESEQFRILHYSTLVGDGETPCFLFRPETMPTNIND